MKGTAVITGASRGIGKSIAKVLARDGYNIAVNYKENEAAANTVLKEIRAINPYCICEKYKGNVADIADVSAMVEKIHEDMGDIQVLVNNAGIAHAGLIQDITPSQWNEMFAVNIGGMYHTIHEILPEMISRKKGKIVNISSVWGIVGASMETHYSASKGAVIAFTKALAKEVAPSGISVNAIAPGAIDTDMLRKLPQETLDEVVEETPFARLGSVEDISEMVSFMVSEKSNFLTGQIISPNGGFVWY